MAITAKGLATRQRIIEGAAELIRDTGVAETTLDDIRSATVTSKSQLFHYFPNGRNELLLAVAHFEADRVLSDQQPHLDDLSNWDSWLRWRDAVVRRYRRQGRTCPMGVLLTELGRNDAASQAVTRSLLLRWKQALAAGVRSLQAASAAPADVDPDRFAGALVAGIQGGVAILLATGDSADLEAALDYLLERLRPTDEPREISARSGTRASSGPRRTA